MARIKIRNPAQLRRVAQSEIGTQIRGELQPLASERSRLQERRTATLQDISRLFGALQPAVAASAANVRQIGQDTTAYQQAVFNQTAAKLDEVRAQRATSAQQLAQEVGGPVPLSSFTDPVDTMRKATSELGAGALLQSSALGQAFGNEAEVYAGQVFPAMQAQIERGAIARSEENIADILDKEASIKSGRGERVNKRFQELLSQEREAGLAQESLDLEKLKANRDYRMAVQSMRQAWKQLGLSEKQIKLQERELLESIASRKAEMGYKYASLAEAKRAALQGEKLAQRELNQRMAEKKADIDDQVRSNAFDYLDALTGSGDKVVTRLVPHQISRKRLDRLIRKNPNANFYTDEQGRAYLYMKTTDTVGADSRVTDDPAGWTTAYNSLVASGLPRQAALNAVRGYFAQPGFTPKGYKAPPKGKGKKGGKK